MSEEWCNHCGELKDIDQYRVVDSVSGRRAKTCRDCRNEIERDQLLTEKRRATLSDLQRVKRSQSINQLWKVINSVAERLGGWSAVVRDWSRQATDKKSTDLQRLRVLDAIVEMRCRLVDHETSQVSELSPDEALAQWHERGQLVPRLRAMLADGRLSLDDIDPAPSDHLAE